MWWVIGGIAAVLAFIGWIVYEMLHAPIIPDMFDGLIIEEDEDDDLVDED